MSFNQFNPSAADAVIYQDNQVNTMAADALAPYITRSSAAIVLTV